MPIYDYVCSTCATRTEFIHGIDAPAPRFCPTCGADGTLRKAFAPPTVHFKGSGWAKKDRSSSARSKAGSTAGADGAKDGGKDGAKDGGKDGAKDGGRDKANPSDRAGGGSDGASGGASTRDVSTAKSTTTSAEG